MPVPAPLLFDLDGTLIDSARSIADALSTIACQRGGNPVTPEQVRPLVSKGVGVLVAAALGAQATDAPADIAAFRAVLGALPADPADLYPGARQSLAALQAADHPMGIVTNKPEGLARGVLHAHGLTGFFGAIFGGDTCHASKPDAEPLLAALAAIAPGCPADEAVMIGDSDVDGLAARAAGCRFIFHERGYGPASADIYPIDGRFSSFDQLDGRFIAFATSACRKAGQSVT